MSHSNIIFWMFLIFTGASVLATFALITRQSLLVAYLLVGVLMGPFGLGWIQDMTTMTQLSHIGIVFLLFLLGLSLDPKSLFHLLGGSLIVTMGSSLCFAAVGFVIPYFFGYPWVECAVVGAAMMFSSTIIALKLLPTTVLHHQRMGEVMISVLLLQDMLAIIALIALDARADAGGTSPMRQLMVLCLGLPGLVVGCILVERYVLQPLFRRFDNIPEYIFLLAVGWSLGVAVLAETLGLSYEIGAFIAGIVIAVSPISSFIAEHLRPLRDFFLVLFFFSLGASLNLYEAKDVWIPAVLLGASMLLLKPVVFQWLLKATKEMPQKSFELGVRLGQVSEFSLLLGYAAFSAELITSKIYFLIQASTLLTFVVSSYWVVIRYPTPVALVESLRRD